MGQRANYIIKNQDKLTIHYTHWRANCIAQDLYLGEKRFLKYVNECKIVDEIINYPWIEGYVIIDILTKHICFWSWEIPNVTSVISYYLQALRDKWTGWTIEHLSNGMYDAEKILAIDYVSKQEFSKLDIPSEEEVIDDKVEEWVTVTVLIKHSNELFVTSTSNLSVESIISYGPKIIELLQRKPRCNLPNEEDATQECIIFDIDSKVIFISQSEFGLWEQTAPLWDSYALIMGDTGYIATLQMANIDTTNLLLPQDKVIEYFTALVAQTSDFNPADFAQRIIQDQKDVVFHPDFFDNTKPNRTIIEVITSKLKSLFKKK